MLRLSIDCLACVCHYASSYELHYIYKLINRKIYNALKTRPEFWKHIILKFSVDFRYERNLIRSIVCTSRAMPLVSNIELDLHNLIRRDIDIKQIVITLIISFPHLYSLYIHYFDNSLYYSFNPVEIFNLVLHSKCIGNLYINRLAFKSMDWEKIGIVKPLRNVYFPKQMTSNIVPELITICGTMTAWYEKWNDYNDFTLWQQYVLQFPSLTELIVPNRMKFIEISNYVTLVSNVLKNTPNLRKLNLSIPNYDEQHLYCDTYTLFNTLSNSCLYLEKIHLNGMLLNVINILYLQKLPKLQTITYKFEVDQFINDTICENLVNMKQLTKLNIYKCNLTIHQMNILYTSSLMICLKSSQYRYQIHEMSSVFLPTNISQIQYLYVSNSFHNLMTRQTNLTTKIIKQCHELHSIHLYEIDYQIIKALLQNAKRWKSIKIDYTYGTINSDLIFHFLNESVELESLVLNDATIFGAPAIFPDKFSITILRERFETLVNKSSWFLKCCASKKQLLKDIELYDLNCHTIGSGLFCYCADTFMWVFFLIFLFVWFFCFVLSILG